MPVKKKNDFSPVFDSFSILNLYDKQFNEPPFARLFEESSSSDFKPDPNSTAKDVAAWMMEEVKTKEELSQKDAACHIMRYFGERFVGQNVNGNMAISPEVLDEFLLISEKRVVWNGRARYWRLRQPGDPKSRRVDD